jgi:flagellar biosynthesis/type III secretory pathway protein FliH
MIFTQLPPLHETQAGKDLIAIGEEKGIEKGIEKAIEKGRKEGQEEGRKEGEVRLIRALQSILCLPISSDAELDGKSLSELRSITASLHQTISFKSL